MSATHRELAIADALETAVRVAATVEHVEFADRSSPVLTVNIDRPSDDESGFRESVGAGKRNADGAFSRDGISRGWSPTEDSSADDSDGGKNVVANASDTS